LAGLTKRFQIDLSKCRIHLYAKSSLKLQNRTVNLNANNDDEDVDNVPLYVKSYFGSGNFAYDPFSLNQIDLIGSNVLNVVDALF